MKNIIFSRRNVDFNIVNLELFSVILELPRSFRTRLHVKSRPNYTQLEALFHGIMCATRRCAPETIIFGFWTLYTHTQLIRDFRAIFLATFFLSVCTITASNQSSHFQKLSLLQPEKWSGCYYNTRVAHLGLSKSYFPSGCPRVHSYRVVNRIPCS